VGRWVCCYLTWDWQLEEAAAEEVLMCLPVDGGPRGQTVRRTNVCHTKWWHENNVPL